MKHDIRHSTNLNNPFIALRHPNFRYYSVGMIVSLIGTWMQNIAQPWLAYTLTQSPILLSLIGALQFTPVLLFSLFAGVIIDKFPKKKILILTQTASLVITLLLAVLVWTGQVRYWHILILSTALGLVNTFDMPARQTFVIELVGKDDLMNAIALNSTVFNLSRIVGPAIAGIIMATSGVAACFFINSFSFAAVLISLFFIKPLALPKPAVVKKRILAEVGAGLRYIRQNPVLVESLLAVAIVGTFAPNFGVLVPVFAKDILKQQESGFGFLMSFLGVGSFLGAMFIAASSRTGPKRYLLTVVPFLIGLFLILNGCAGTFVLAALSLALTGFFFVSFTSNANSTLQLNTGNDYRGRVMSAYSLVLSGSTPIGNLYAGAFTDRISARAGFIACGAAILVLMVPLLIHIRRRRLKEGVLTGNAGDSCRIKP